MTLIELLVAMSIMVILMAFLVPQVSVLRRKAYISESLSVVKKIESALSAYYDKFLAYPPDGYDQEPGYTYGNGVRLGNNWKDSQPRFFKGTGSLVYFLCLPVTMVTRKGVIAQGVTSSRNLRTQVVGPFLTDMMSKNFSIGEFELLDILRDPEAAKVEIVDGWGRPLEYDKVPANKQLFFQPELFDGDLFGQGRPHFASTRNSVSIDEDDPDDPQSTCGIAETINGAVDPRRPAGTDGCIRKTSSASPQNVGHYDVWSHGPLWADPNDDIGTWSSN
jgi:type II secretory pathway pseudopilin PulG